jgi:hypothetical protein
VLFFPYLLREYAILRVLEIYSGLYFMKSALVCIALLTGSALTASAITFADSSFSNTLWSGQKISASSTPNTSFTATYFTSFGGRTDVRLVTHTFGLAAPTRSDIYTFHALSTTSYDPAILGALASVSISFNINSDFGGTSGGVLQTAAVLQGSTVFTAVYGVTFTGSGWQFYNAPGLQAANFTSATATNPDFSATGAPIFFGFALGNGSNLGISTSTQTYIDNFSAVATPAPIPEPSSAALALGVAALVATAHRRSRPSKRGSEQKGSWRG